MGKNMLKFAKLINCCWMELRCLIRKLAFTHCHIHCYLFLTVATSVISFTCISQLLHVLWRPLVNYLQSW